MYLAKVNIVLKESVLDPQGQTVKKVIIGMGESQLRDVRVGKYVELLLDCETEEDAQKMAQRICEKVLVNSVIETYSLSLEKK